MKLDLITNATLVDRAIKFITEKQHTKKEKLESSQKEEEEDNNNESKEPNYNEDTQGEEEQEKETGEIA
jgi:hypothetical protein